ncbi:MAG: hypothetical protein NVS9B14_21180 [Candidatus Acidiferrum sp.]
MFVEPSEVGIDIGGGAEFTGVAEEIGGEFRVHGLLRMEMAFAVGVEEAEVFVIRSYRHGAGAAVGERKLARFYSFHKESRQTDPRKGSERFEILR